jgi:hypothetical protein
VCDALSGVGYTIISEVSGLLKYKYNNPIITLIKKYLNDKCLNNIFYIINVYY